MLRLRYQARFYSPIQKTNDRSKTVLDLRNTKSPQEHAHNLIKQKRDRTYSSSTAKEALGERESAPLR